MDDIRIPGDAIEQTEQEILSGTVTDEELEAAAGAERGAEPPSFSVPTLCFPFSSCC